MSAYAPTMAPSVVPVPVHPRGVATPEPKRRAPALAAPLEELSQASAHDVQSLPALSEGFRVALTIISVMAIGAAVVATAVLKPTLVLLGFVVGLCLMTFIGFPLILAAIADVRDARERP